MHDPESHDRETIVWAFAIVDQEGEWGWRTVASKAWWRSILPKLQRFESMTWTKIKETAGGKQTGTNSHSVSVEKLSKKAQKRLKELGQEDVSELFSLRLTGKARIFGIRDQRALKLLWYRQRPSSLSRTAIRADVLLHHQVAAVPSPRVIGVARPRA